MIDDRDVYATSKLVIKQHGQSAADYARARVEELQLKESGEAVSYADHEIFDGAQAIIEGHGGSARYFANSRREDCRNRGDMERVDFWTRVIAAIEFLHADKATGEQLQ